MSIKYNIMNFVNVTKIVIPQGEVIQIQDNLSRILWKKNMIDYSIPFWVRNISGSSQSLYIGNGSNNTWFNTINPQYRRGKSGSWTNFGEIGNYNKTRYISISAGETIYLRCACNSWSYGSATTGGTTESIGIDVTGAYEVGGNILSLLYGSSFNSQSEFPSDTYTYTFYGLFSKNARGTQTYVNNIRSAEKLIIPCANINYCCKSMFSQCTYLTTGPALPATSITYDCYYGMFYGCTALTSAPELPATTLFARCYSGMFQDCTSLVVAPKLPAETLTTNCYDSMFDGCTSLEEVHMLATTWDTGTDYWLRGVAETGTFYINPNAEYDPRDYVENPSGIPENWDVRYEGE